MPAFFTNMRIRHKILIVSLLVLLVSSLSTLFSYRYLSLELRSRTIRLHADAMSGAMDELDRFIGELDMLAFTTCSNANLQRFILQNANLNRYEYSQLYTTVSEVLTQISIPREDFRVHVFSESLQHPIISESGSRWVQEGYRFTEDDWYVALAAQTESNRVIIANGTQHYYHPSIREPVTTFAYRILSRGSLEVVGYLLIDVNKTYFNHFFNKTGAAGPDMYLFTSGHIPIYEVVHREEIDVAALRGQLQKSGWRAEQVLRLEGEDHLVTFGRSAKSGWESISLQPAKELLVEFRLISAWFTVGFLLMLGLAMILSMKLAGSITTPIETLSREMKVAKRGHLPLPVPVHSKDESGELVREFNEMMVEINDLLRRNEQMAVLKKEAELNALQKQINPHFIYNTLEIMIGLACEGDTGVVISVCKRLGRMLSYNLDTRKYVPLEDELRHTENYLQILENSSGERFSSRFDVDPEAKGLLVLKFIVQPFVENAIIHGFADTVSGGLLLVKVHLVDQRLCIEITDNGKGMDEQTRAGLLVLLGNTETEEMEAAGAIAPCTPCIGIRNVLQRMWLQFGEDAGFDVISRPGEGTRMLLFMPPLQVARERLKSQFLRVGQQDNQETTVLELVQ